MLKQILNEVWIYVVVFVIIMGSVFGYTITKHFIDENNKNKCIEKYNAFEETISQEEYRLINYCEKDLCEGFGFNIASTGNWAKPIIYCEGLSGGLVQIQMPQHPKNQKCINYFNRRWDLAMCLYEANYIEEFQ